MSDYNNNNTYNGPRNFDPYTGEPIHNNQDETPKAPKPPARKPNRPHPVLLIIVCIILSAACGFGGAAAGIKLLGNTADTEETTAQTDDSSSESEQTQTAGTTSSSTASSDIASAAAIASPSVVQITVTENVTQEGFFGQTQSYSTTGAGSGVIISSDGYIITNNHVVESAEKIQVTTSDGSTYDATLVGTDSDSDIGVVKIEAEGLTAATIGDSSSIAAGDTAIVIGNPLGTLGGSVTCGIISSPSREVVIDNTYMDLIQTDATVNSGNSGGGLFDADGNLIGIVNSKYSGTTSSGSVIEGIGFAIPINYAIDIAQQLEEYGTVTDRATIGISVQTLTQQYMGYEPGVYIVGITDGSGAEAAGLQEYDRIVSIDGTDVSEYSDIKSILRDKSPGDTISMVIERDGKSITVDVTLGNSSSTASTTESTAAEDAKH